MSKKRRISPTELDRLLANGGVMRVARVMNAVGSDKIHADIEIFTPPPPLTEIHFVLLSEENPDEELDVEDVDHGGGVLHHLPGSGRPPGGGDHDPQ